MSYELLIQHGSNIMYPPTVEGVTIEWERKGQPGKLTFEVVKTPGLSFQEGDPCRFSVDGTPVFYGFVFEKSRKGNNPNVIKCVVYDQLYYMDSLGLELNEKTQIFPIRNGIDFLGFHTYLTESGKVIRKLRHSSIKRMRAKLRHWEKEYPAGLVTREQILQSWQAWDAHAAHGNTWALRQQVRDRVQNILKEEI